MSAFHILSALSSGIKAFESTGNPYAALGAAAIGGFSDGGASGTTPSQAGGDLIGSLLGGLSGGNHDALKGLADQKPLDFSGLLSGDATQAAA